MLLNGNKISQLPTFHATIGSTTDDKMMPLLLLQMVTQRNDPSAMASMYPLLLSTLMGSSTTTNDKTMYYLLLGAGNNKNMQQWLPLILNNKNSDTDDKLLMMLFMQQQQATGTTNMNNMFPLLLMNSGSQKYCAKSGSECTCSKSTSDMLLYIMLLNGNNFGPGQQKNNFMFLLFDDKTCKGKLKSTSAACECTKSDSIQGGIDAVTYMMMMQMNPTVRNNLPVAPPQRAIDVSDLLKKQLFQNLGPEYAWMANVADTSSNDLMKFQLYQQLGIPPNVMSLLSAGGAKTNDEKFALIQWMARDSQMSIETMSLMLGIEDSRQFYIHSMIEQGQVDPMTASLLLASAGGVSQSKIKELLIQAATGQIDPKTFATLGKPYIPQLPEGIFPGQDLFFIHLELLDVNTCALVKPDQRKACGGNYGKYITAEQCEVHPYCCYNPYFGTAANIPWCYYNIFFVFHDQYSLRVREADKFKGPQDCPGLFRYGLNLDPLLYYQASKDIVKVGNNYHFQVGKNEKLTKLIHYRVDMGFPGITQFHCRAILGMCWDDNAQNYPGDYQIPQCYEERAIGNIPVVGTLQTYKPELFKPVVPTEFRATDGECDTNYFHISTLYYERRACTYSIDMIKYGSEFSPLEEPSRADCLFRLGCCYEDNEDVMQKYNFLPRCYHRVKNTKSPVYYVAGSGKTEKLCGVDADAVRALIVPAPPAAAGLDAKDIDGKIVANAEIINPAHNWCLYTYNFDNLMDSTTTKNTAATGGVTLFSSASKFFAPLH